MSNAKRVNLSAERIEAIDAKEPSAQSKINALRIPGSGLSDAEAACILSHREAWKKLIASTDSFLAIFEDDAHLSDDIGHLLSFDQMAENLDLVKLETPSGKVSYAWKAYAPFCGRKLHRLITKAYGAGGYIVSRKCAQRLLEISEKCDEPVDVILFDEKSPIWNEFPVLQIVPAACIQDSELSKINRVSERFGSTIESERKVAKILRKSRNKKNKKTVAFKAFRRYIHCIMNGANPFKYKTRVSLELGRLSAT